MELILWRHAQAVDADGTIDDLKRSLTQEGEHQAAEMAAWLARHMPTDTRILVSPALRTRQTVLRLTKQTALTQRLSPGATSHRRRQEWPSEDAVLQHFAAKPVFASWHPDALRDYIRHGTELSPSLELPLRRTLAFHRDLETAIYNTLPDNLDLWLRQHPLKVPAAMIGGSRSRELRQVGMGTPRRITQGRIYLLDGGTHLFPLEQPEQTASLVSRALAELQH